MGNGNTNLQSRDWVPEQSERYIQSIASSAAARSADEIERDLLAYVAENRTIHERDCVNLNPATNVMNPKAEALLAAGIGSRPSLGYPGDKYEMGLEGIEKIEVMAAELAAEIFGARFAEIRVGSGALANLYVFMMAAEARRYHHRAAAADRRPCDASRQRAPPAAMAWSRIRRPIDPMRYTRRRRGAARRTRSA